MKCESIISLRVQVVSVCNLFQVHKLDKVKAIFRWTAAPKFLDISHSFYPLLPQWFVRTIGYSILNINFFIAGCDDRAIGYDFGAGV